MITRILPLVGTMSLVLGLIYSCLWYVQEAQAPVLQATIASAPIAEVATKKQNSDIGRSVPPPDYFDVLSARPIFAPDRKPQLTTKVEAPPKVEIVEPVIQPVPVAPVVPPEFSVLGVMGRTKGMRALIASDGGAPKWMSSGEAIEGWILSEVFIDAVEFSQAGETIRIEMYK